MFVDGLFVNRRESAPEFIIASLSISVPKLIKFLNENANARGFVNIDIKRSDKGSMYAALNEWKPAKIEGMDNKIEKSYNPELSEAMYGKKEAVEEINVDEIPF